MLKKDLQEVRVLEELFLDQLIFQIHALLALHTITSKNSREINSFIKQLEDLTDHNISILNSLYVGRE